MTVTFSAPSRVENDARTNLEVHFELKARRRNYNKDCYEISEMKKLGT